MLLQKDAGTGTLTLPPSIDKAVLLYVRAHRHMPRAYLDSKYLDATGRVIHHVRVFITFIQGTSLYTPFGYRSSIAVSFFPVKELFAVRIND